MAIRAFWQAYNRHGQLDRIELHDSEYGGAEPELEFHGDGTGFTRQWDEITSESNEKLINIQANRIQIGKYDFRPRIENQTGFDILEDIRDSDNKRFHIVHKIDGTFEWAGWVTTRIFSYPEKDNNFFAHIRATDFEILKGIDYPLSDNRQTFITTFADLFSELPEDTPIKTATSWVEENVTARVGSETYDFLDEIRHETKALRDFGRTGDETDQPITKWEALEHVAEPGLLIRQMGGHVMIDQLTDLADPTAVNETVYDSTGSVTTATQSVDRRQTGYATADNGTPSIKVSSQNDTYPAIKRAKNKYDHRTSVSTIQFPDQVTLDETAGSEQSFSQAIISDGGQSLNFSANIWADITENEVNGRVQWTIQAAGYYWNEGDREWQPTGSFNGTNETSLTFIGPGAQTTGASLWQGSIDINTTHLPNDADGTITITLRRALSDSNWALETRWEDTAFSINNAIASENSESINYQLTQDSFEAPEIITLDDTWFGDLPTGYSPGALRHGTGAGDLTTETWRRRGQTIDYRNYHWNLLAEVIDMGRTNMRKLEADIWGAYDPTKVLDYNGSYFYFAGGKYDGTRGRWRVTLMELNLQTGSDTFDDIPKFTDETGSGSGSTSGGGGGGGLDQSTADARYVQEQGDSMSGNLDLSGNDLQNVENFTGNAIGSDLQAHSSVLDNVADNNATADLDLNSLAINGDDLFSLFYTEQEINSFFDLYYSKADLTDGDEDLYLNSLQLTSLTQDRIPVVGADGLLEDTSMFTFDGHLNLGTNVDVSSTGNSDFTISSDGSITVGIDQNANDSSSIFRLIKDGNTSSTLFRITQTPRIGLNADPDDLLHLKSNTGTSAGIVLDEDSGEQVRLQNNQDNNDFRIQTTDGGGFTTKVEVQQDGSTTIGGVGGSTLLTVKGVSTFEDNVLSNDFTDATWAGNGYRGTNEGDWVVENLRVRNALEVYEFVAKQISSVGGKEILSIANGRIEEVEPSSKTNVISVQDVDGQDVTSLEQGDLWIVQEVNVNNDKASGGSGGVTRSAHGSVVNDSTSDGSLSGNEVELSFDQGTISDLEKNDLIVVYGSSDSDRNAIMYRNVDRSDDNLIMRMQTGVTSFSALTDPANTSVAYGDLNGYLGISSEEFGFFAGDVSGNYILATENQVNAKLDDLKLDVIGSGSSGFTNADFFLDASAHQMSLGSVFSADGGADTGTLAGLDFDSGALVTGDGSLGSYTAGTVTGLQPRTATPNEFFAGADDKDGTNARVKVNSSKGLSLSPNVNDQVTDSGDTIAPGGEYTSSSITLTSDQTIEAFVSITLEQVTSGSDQAVGDVILEAYNGSSWNELDRVSYLIEVDGSAEEIDIEFFASTENYQQARIRITSVSGTSTENVELLDLDLAEYSPISQLNSTGLSSYATESLFVQVGGDGTKISGTLMLNNVPFENDSNQRKGLQDGSVYVDANGFLKLDTS